MKMNSESNDQRSLSEKYFVNDLYEIIISSASDPSLMMKKFSSILREYIGAKEIILFECNESVRYGHKLVSQLYVDEDRKRGYFEFAEYTHKKSNEIMHFTAKNMDAFGERLRALGYKDVIAVPISSGSNRLGCMHIYGSLQEDLYQQVYRLVDSIRPLIGVVLENYQLFHNMDALLSEKTMSLRTTNKEMETLINTVPDLVITTDENLSLLKIFNYVAQRYYFIEMDEGGNFALYITEEQSLQKKQAVEALLDGEMVMFTEEILSGERKNYLENRIKRNGNQYLHIIRNITESVEAETRIQFMNRYDQLTGLLNRNAFYKRLKAFKNPQGPISVLLIDMNGLKLLNETLGFATGDHYLQMLAKACDRVKLEGTDIFRVGDDEMVFLMQGKTRGQIMAVVNHLKAEVDQLNHTIFTTFPLSISYGFHINEDENAPDEQVFNIAENNLNQDKLLHSESNKSALVHTLTKALEARDFITEGHADRMEQLLERFAQRLDLGNAVQNNLRLFGKFHDIGKVGISDVILFKPGKLTDEEMTNMQKHCEIGYKIALTAADLHPIADLILKHHERYDGRGYPIGLCGEEIPLECRILSIVDAYDAMTNDRPYRRAMPHEAAVEELLKNRGTQFDASLVDFFIHSVL